MRKPPYGAIHTEVWLFQKVDFFLEIGQKSAGVGTVHLSVVELEGEGQGVPEQLLFIPAPDQEGIVENAAVHAYSTVNLGVDDGRGADDHTGFGQIPILAGGGNLGGMGQIFPVKGFRVLCVQKIAGTDLSGFVFYNGVYGDGIVLNQLVAYGEDVEFLHIRGCFSNTVSKQHVELPVSFPADTDQVGDIHGFEEGNHGIGGVHPEFKSHGSGGILGIDLSGHGVLLQKSMYECTNLGSSLCANSPGWKKQSKSAQKNEAYAPQLHK